MVKIRLRRDGAKKNPYYTLVVADSRFPSDGRFIEKVGTYNPMVEPAELKVDTEKVTEWIKKGAKKNPYYTLVVADSRFPSDGRFIEKVGTYNPMVEPAELKVDTEKVTEWIKKGAKPTDTAAALIKKAGVEI